MYKNLVRFSLIIFIFISNNCFSQVGCTINAGSNDPDYCLNQNLTLYGNLNGDIDLNTIKWELVSFPSGSQVVIENSISLTTRTTPAEVIGEYVFRLSATCLSGLEIQQEVIYLVNDIPDSSIDPIGDLGCKEINSIIELKGAEPRTDEFVKWEIIKGAARLLNSSSNEAELVVLCGRQISLNTDPIEITLTYTVSTVHRCSSTDTIVVKYDPYMVPELGYKYFQCDSCYYFDIDGCAQSDSFDLVVTNSPEGFNYDVDLLKKNKTLCNVPDGNYSLQLINYGQCSIDTVLLDLFIRIRYEETFGGDEVEKFSLCIDDINRDDTLSFEAVEIPEDIDGSWEVILGSGIIIDPYSKVLKVTNLSPGVHEFSYNINDLSLCSQLYIIQIVVENDTEFSLVNVGKNEQLYFCADLINYNGAFSEDTFIYTKQKVSFDLISYPQTFNENDSISIEVVESRINFLPDLVIDFDQNNLSHIFHAENTYFRGKENIFSLKVIDVSKPGLYRLKVGTEFSCGGDFPTPEFFYEVIDLEVIMKDTLFVNAGTDIILDCGIKETKLAGNLTSGTWSVQSAPAGAPVPVFSEPIGRSTDLTNLVPGTYCISYSGFYSANSSCTGIWYTDEVKVIVADNPPLELGLEPKIEICASVDFNHIFNPVLPLGNWEKINGGPLQWNADHSHFSLSGSPNVGIYEFVYTVDNGCGGTQDTLLIEIIDGGLEPAFILTQDSCISFISSFSFPLRLEAQEVTGDNIGMWRYLGSGNASFAPDVFQPIVDVVVSDIGLQDFLLFEWKVENTSCPNQSRDTVVFKQRNLRVDLNNEPIVDCAAFFPDTILLTMGPILNGSNITWQLISQSPIGVPPIILTPNDDSTLVVFSEPGEYTFSLTAVFENSCDKQIINEIQFVKLSESEGTAYAGENQSICGQDSVFNLVGLPHEANGQWTVISTSSLNLSYTLEDKDTSSTKLILNEPGHIVLRWEVFGADPSCGVSTFDEIMIDRLDFAFTEDSLSFCSSEGYYIPSSDYRIEDVNWSLEPNVLTAKIDRLINGGVLLTGIDAGNYTLIGSLGNDSCAIIDSVHIYIKESTPSVRDSLEICLSAVPHDGLKLPYIINLEDLILDTIILVRRPRASDGEEIIEIDEVNNQIRIQGIDQNGKYVIRYKFSDGLCDAYFTYILNVSNRIFLNLPDLFSVCMGDSVFVDLSSYSNVVFEWTPEEFVFRKDSESLGWYSDTSQYLFVKYFVEGDSSCFNLDSIFMEVLPKPIITFIGDTLFCSRDTAIFELAFDGDYQVEWYDNPNLIEIISTDNPFETLIDETKTYYYRIKSNISSTCDVLDSFSVSFSEIIAELPESYSICEDPILKVLTIEGENLEELTIRWNNDPSIITSLDSSQIIVEPIGTTSYSVNIENDLGCSISLSTTVFVTEIKEPIVLTADPNQILPGEESQLLVIPSSTSFDYNWTPGMSLSDSTIFNPIARPIVNTTYTVIIEQNNCIDSASVSISVLNACLPPLIYVPNAFTPNGDNLNDTYGIIGEYIEEYFLAIYNRWGEKVFESHHVDDKWDGTFRGEKVVPDVYGFYLKLGCAGGSEYKKKGNVTVLF